MTNITGIVWALALCVLGGTIAFGFRQCQDSRSQYYDAVKDCTAHGGTWVPMNNGDVGGHGMCLSPSATLRRSQS